MQLAATTAPLATATSTTSASAASLPPRRQPLPRHTFLGGASVATEPIPSEITGAAADVPASEVGAMTAASAAPLAAMQRAIDVAPQVVAREKDAEPQNAGPTSGEILAEPVRT